MQDFSSSDKQVYEPGLSLDLPSTALAARLRAQFRGAGYNEQNLARLTGHVSPVLLEGSEPETLRASLTGHGALGLLIRLFFLEQSVDCDEYRAALDENFRTDLERCGLLRTSGKTVAARVLLVPIEGRLIAGDRYRKHSDELTAEHVLSVNQSARLLARLALREPVGRLLDLCTGNGIFAVLLAPHAHERVATDLNPRALVLARFNLALNGVDKVILRQGSLFEPVKGERFDQIICNPPYIITPTRRLMSTETDEELDNFCRNLVSSAPAFLNENGVIQLTCEWVDDGATDWRAYLSSWFEGLGCDAWAICMGYTPIIDYARRRRAQARATAVARDDQDTLEGWCAHFSERNVTGIRSGFIQLRRRRGVNWQSFTTLAAGLTDLAGKDIARGFMLRDLFLSMADRALLKLRPLPEKSVAIETVGQEGKAQRLRKTRGLPISFSVSPAIGQLVGQLDGSKELAEVSDQLAMAARLPSAAVRRECAQVCRELLAQGLLVVPPE